MRPSAPTRSRCSRRCRPAARIAPSPSTRRAARAPTTSLATLADSVGIDEDGFDRAEERATLANLLTTVTPRERDVLRMRFEEDMTQAEIGAVIGVSQMQVSRVIRQALSRLRAAAGADADEAPAR